MEKRNQRLPTPSMLAFIALRGCLQHLSLFLILVLLCGLIHILLDKIDDYVMLRGDIRFLRGFSHPLQRIPQFEEVCLFTKAVRIGKVERICVAQEVRFPWLVSGWPF